MTEKSSNRRLQVAMQRFRHEMAVALKSGNKAEILNTRVRAGKSGISLASMSRVTKGLEVQRRRQSIPISS